MDNQLSKKIETLGNNFAAKSDHLSKARINKSDFDKTLIGFVSEKVENDDGSYYWIIQVEGAAYKINPEMCNITETGQKVRLFLPNHNYRNKYAEVIADHTSANEHPDEAVYNYNDGTITETWNHNDGTQTTQVYKFDYANKGTSNEQITAITFPDGSKMTLEGF